VSTVCAACHGADGNSLAPTFPKLAGLQEEYLAKQLKDYLAGKRKNEIMAPTIASLKADDVAGLAAHFAAQKPSPGKVEDAKLAEAGKKLYEDGNTESGVPACMGCHQPQGEGNARYPRLAGQHQTYTLQQMADFKSGTRANDRGKVMRAVAERMTDQEMKAVSEYIAGL
jgi:cytochrome c553